MGWLPSSSTYEFIKTTTHFDWPIKMKKKNPSNFEKFLCKDVVPPLLWTIIAIRVPMWKGYQFVDMV
jgi:hypothetical protein